MENLKESECMCYETISSIWVKNKVQVERNACEKFETIWSIPFLCGLEELIPPCQIYSGIYYNWLHSLRPAKEFIRETRSQLCHSVLLCSDRTYSFHPMSLVWSIKLRCLGTEEKTWIKSAARDKREKSWAQKSRTPESCQLEYTRNK